jgi:hypothetical protein
LVLKAAFLVIAAAIGPQHFVSSILCPQPSLLCLAVGIGSKDNLPTFQHPDGGAGRSLCTFTTTVRVCSSWLYLKTLSSVHFFAKVQAAFEAPVCEGPFYADDDHSRL